MFLLRLSAGLARKQRQSLQSTSFHWRDHVRSFSAPPPKPFDANDENITIRNDQDPFPQTEEEEDSLRWNRGSAPPLDDPWKLLLSMPARASWRAVQAERLSRVDKSITAVLKHSVHPTSPKATKKTLKTLSENQKTLSRQRNRERARASGQQPYRKTANLNSLRKKAKDDQKAVMYGPHETVANMKFRLRPNYYITKRVLEEAYSLVGRTGEGAFRPQRILDFGIGCGAASAAALEVFGNDSHIEWIHGIDASQAMREAADRFLNEFVQLSNAEKDVDSTDNVDQETMTTTPTTPWSPRITLSAHLSSDPTMSSERLTTTMTRAAFDICLFTYTATELAKSRSTMAAAALLWEKLKPGGLLVVIEPGTPDGFSSIRTIRNMLLDCCPPNGNHLGEDECHIIAPCTHNGPCPLGVFLPPRDKSDGKEEDDEAARDKHAGPILLPSSFADSEARSSEELAVTKEDPGEAEYDEDMAYENDFDEEEEEDEEDELTKPRKWGFCSFVQTFPNQKGEKFSYLVAQKRVAGVDGVHGANRKSETFGRANLSNMIAKQFGVSPEDDPELHEVLNNQASHIAAQYLESEEDQLGLEMVKGQVSSFGRIVRAPRKHSRIVNVDCCTEQGLVRHSVVKSMSKRVPGLYEASRKTRWGGLWPNLRKEPKKTSQ